MLEKIISSALVSLVQKLVVWLSKYVLDLLEDYQRGKKIEEAVEKTSNSHDPSHIGAVIRQM